MSNTAAFIIAALYFNARGWHVHSAICALCGALPGALRIAHGVAL